MSNRVPGSQRWLRAYGYPNCSGVIKQDPSDFEVVELLDILPSGNGEHIWVSIRKTRQNTDRVARELAKFVGVAYRDVGYSGLKDYLANTTQWFSIWLPKGDDPNWREFEFEGVEILDIARHNRKIKRGTHSANYFSININQLEGDLAQLEQKLKLIVKQGVPNYFGQQRFGRDGNNIEQARLLFAGMNKVKNRNHRSLLLSAARSWIFNNIVSQRVEQGSWCRLHEGEPANLDGSASIFSATGEPNEQARLDSLDIHPTAPMWGLIDESNTKTYADLHLWESDIAGRDSDLADGLIQLGLKHQRRALRCKVDKLSWGFENQQLNLKFTLRRGHFATSVLRELIDHQT